MTQTITRLYDSHADAQKAMQALRQAGLTDQQISLVANRGADGDTETATDAGTGAATADPRAGGSPGAGIGCHRRGDRRCRRRRGRSARRRRPAGHSRHRPGGRRQPAGGDHRLATGVVAIDVAAEHQPAFVGLADVKMSGAEGDDAGNDRLQPFGDEGLQHVALDRQPHPGHGGHARAGASHGDADVDDPLLSARRGWLSAALQVEDGDGFGVELAARALLTATWTIDDVSAEGIEAFPGMTAIDGAGRYPALLGWLQALLRNEIADAPTILPTLLAQLTRLGEPKRAEQARFWEVPSQPIMETLARELIASPGLDVTDLQPLQALLARARLDVLATDIGKLGKFVAGGTPLPREWHMPAAETIRPIVRQACLLGNGTLLIWRESNVLQLLGRHGAPLGVGQANDARVV
eukprot:gene34131-45762_t